MKTVDSDLCLFASEIPKAVGVVDWEGLLDPLLQRAEDLTDFVVESETYKPARCTRCTTSYKIVCA